MKLIAGLGNPGPSYAHSRHNAGFMVIDELARVSGTRVETYEKSYEAQAATLQIGSERVLLLKPLTYMNLSGRSVGAVWRFYKLALTDLLVICDDMDLPPGRLRLRAGGSSGGQNGLADVIRHVGGDQFARLRVGVGRPERAGATDHVLGTFAPQERELIAPAIQRAAAAALTWVRAGLTAAMNEFNKADEPPRERKPRGTDAAQGESA